MGALETAIMWDAVHDPNVGGTWRAEELLEGMQAAGYSEEVAQKAASARAWARVQKDLPP